MVREREREIYFFFFFLTHDLRSIFRLFFTRDTCTHTSRLLLLSLSLSYSIALQLFCAFPAVEKKRQGNFHVSLERGASIYYIGKMTFCACRRDACRIHLMRCRGNDDFLMLFLPAAVLKI